MKKTVLITGAYGFVGSNLSKALAAGNHIIALDIRKLDSGLYHDFYSWADLEKIPWSEIGVIIHLAGKAHDTKNQAQRKEYFEVNAELTKKIFDFFLQSKAGKFIYFSSVKAAADKVDGVLTEDVTPSPRGPYGESKLAAERYLSEEYEKYEEAMRRLCDGATLRGYDLETKGSSDKKTQYPERGTRNAKHLYILRPCMIHGPGNKGNLNSLVTLVKKGIPYPLGAYDNRRSFTSIDNLCYVITELINRDVPSGIYNMADDEPVSTNDLVKISAEVLGKNGRVWKVNMNIINVLATTGSVLHMPFTIDTLNKLTEDYVVSNKKLKKALGISKMPIQATEGLRKTISAMTQQ